MKTFSNITALRRYLDTCRRETKTIGFVPTMGALHEGHARLLTRCRRSNDICVLSIFVNPAQFGPREDFRSYPRTRVEDSALARECGCDVLFYPSVKTMYPHGARTTVSVPDVSRSLCGSRRPGHFDGVATVVTKLLNIVQPHHLYLGQKDLQQTVVLRQMIQDLNLPVRCVIVPTVREPDGLAMSSRNAYLSADQRRDAAVLYRALRAAKQSVLHGERNAARIRAIIRRMIAPTGGRIDYIECVHLATLTPLKMLDGPCAIALAVFFGRARLIDNIILQI